MKKLLFTGMLLMSMFFVLGQIPSGYYDDAELLSGNNLKNSLHQIIKNHKEYSYSALRDYILRESDEDPNNSENIILLYTGRSQNKNTFNGGVNGWNREHVWAKSHGDFGTHAPAGTDAHHLRPCDVSVNSSRGNKDFAAGGNAHSEATGCHYTSSSWEPRDEVKGDVARMLFYMAVRYEGESGEPDLEVVDKLSTSPEPLHGKLSDLLQWNALDAPDDFERNRNEVVYSYQQNRNPFIDHPEYVNKIWGPNAGVNDGVYQNVSLYPNPVQDNLYMLFDDNSFSGRGVIVSVYATTGQVVLMKEIEDICYASVNLSELSEGVYTVQIKDDKMVYARKSIIKVK